MKLPIKIIACPNANEIKSLDQCPWYYLYGKGFTTNTGYQVQHTPTRKEYANALIHKDRDYIIPILRKIEQRRWLCSAEMYLWYDVIGFDPVYGNSGGPSDLGQFREVWISNMTEADLC
jgi:hypothetical protein